MQFSIFNFSANGGPSFGGQFSKKILFIAAAIIIFISAAVSYPLFSKPDDFHNNSLVRIEDGLTLSQIGARLKERKIIKSNFFFTAFAKITGREDGIKAGDYFFEKPISLFVVVSRLSSADFGLEPVRVTVWEGMALKDIAEVFSGFENFNKKKFLAETDGMEGYLFPDTYFFLPNAGTEAIIRAMRNNFSRKAGEIDYDTLIMASIIEREAADRGDRRIISGILWKRLKTGMPLQVDAVFPYIKGKAGRVFFEDLKIDSPYNTYLYKGLPPTPICNPGADAIDAARNPVESPYWYYLSDKKGVTYFASTFKGHKTNRAKYLR